MKIFDDLEKKIDRMNDDIIEDTEPANDPKVKKVGRKAQVTDPYLQISSSQGTYRQKFTRLSNKMLRESATRDTIIASVIRHRRTQIEAFCSIPHTRFDTGFTFVRRDGMGIGTDDHDNVSKLANWMYFCGEVKSTPFDDRTTLATQFGMMAQDALTFGHVAVEKVRDKIGGLQRFRHVSGESVFHATRNIPADQIRAAVDSNISTISVSNKQEGEVAEESNNDEVKYIQVINGREVGQFTDKTMTFQLFQPPSYIDNNGYSTSLVEASILAITRHLQAENYNSLFFTHGFAARGLLHLKGNVSQQNLQMFRNQFNAVINGNNNSWRTPIIAGLDEVQWVPLAGTSRDMEYIQYTDHLIRTICAIAQIDPTEIGFEYLSRGTQQSTLNSPNNEWKLTASQERGLVPLLRFFEDIVNHNLLPEIDPELSKLYMFKFIGLQSETRQQEFSRLQAEMTIHSSLNDLLSQVKKDPLSKDLCGDIPLNQSWWNLVKELKTVGELREALLGDKDASKNKDYMYIATPMFMQWQTIMNQKAQQEEQQAAQKREQQSAEEQQAAQEQQDNMSGVNANPPQLPPR